MISLIGIAGFAAAFMVNIQSIFDYNGSGPGGNISGKTQPYEWLLLAIALASVALPCERLLKAWRRRSPGDLRPVHMLPTVIALLPLAGILAVVAGSFSNAASG